MKLKEYEKFIEELESRGYKKYPTIKRATFTYFKAFGKSKYEEDRSNYQIAFSLYDWRKYADRDPSVNDNPFGVQPTIMVSRTIHEGFDLDFCCEFSDIEYIESLAEKFFKFVEENVKVNHYESED